MNKAQKIHKQLKELPYFRNYQAVSGSVHNVSSHEDAVEDVLINNKLIAGDFKQIAQKQGFSSVIVFRDALLQGDFTDSIPNNTYYSQPTGTHNSPDFIFKANDKIFFVECKSGKSNKPMYNGGLPKIGYIYLFCSQKSGKTTMFLGEDIVNDKQRQVIDEFITESDKRVVALNKKLSLLDSQKRGIQYYQRHMWQQGGTAKYTDYFSHENKDSSEQKVEKLFNDTKTS